MRRSSRSEVGETEASPPYTAHRDRQWVISAVSAAPLALLFALLMPPVGAVAALLAVVAAVVAIRTRPTHHRGLLTAALVMSSAALLWSLFVVVFLIAVNV